MRGKGEERKGGRRKGKGRNRMVHNSAKWKLIMRIMLLSKEASFAHKAHYNTQSDRRASKAAHQRASRSGYYYDHFVEILQEIYLHTNNKGKPDGKRNGIAELSFVITLLSLCDKLRCNAKYIARYDFLFGWARESGSTLFHRFLKLKRKITPIPR